VLDEIADYTPGRGADVVAREHGVLDAVKLASNEAPFPPPASVRRAIADAALSVHRYPDDGATALRERLAARAGLDADQVVLGAGSLALCQQALLATVDPGDEVVWCWPSFEAYPILARHADAQICAVPLRDDRYDLDAIFDAIGARTRLVVICNPNNPTGTIVRRDELGDLLTRVSSDLLVVIDEAYHEFVTAPDSPDGLELVRAHPNVLVLRTFSKAYALAGLRVGYGFAQPEVTSALRCTRHPFGVNAVAQAAALAALDAEAELRAAIDHVIAERGRVTQVCRDRLDVAVPDSEANFVWLPLGDRADAVAHACEQRGVVLRAFGGFGVRATIGTQAENDRMLEALAATIPVVR